MSRRRRSKDSNRSSYEQKYPNFPLWDNGGLPESYESSEGWRFGYDDRDMMLVLISPDGEVYDFHKFDEGRVIERSGRDVRLPDYSGKFFGSWAEMREVDSDSDKAPIYKLVIKPPRRDDDSDDGDEPRRRRRSSDSDGRRDRDRGRDRDRDRDEDEDSEPRSRRRGRDRDANDDFDFEPSPRRHTRRDEDERDYD